MPPTPVLRSRLEEWLRRSPISAFRDVVGKRPSVGPNLAALDGVRGLAVLLVVAAHADGFHMKGHGAVGVWLFFSLSAFLLTLPFAAAPELATDPAHLKRFVVRRLLRILPAYYLAIGVVAWLRGDGAGIVVQHLVFARATGIFWTVPQEMLFYALLPPLAWLHASFFRGNFAATALGFAGLALAANAWLSSEVFALHGNDKLLRFHLGVFLCGMAFAYAVHTPALARFVAKPRVNRALDLAGVAILAGLVLSAPWFVERIAAALSLPAPSNPRWALQHHGVTGFACATLVYLTTVCEGRLSQRILSSLLLRSLGVVSFSLYLFHVVAQNGIQVALPFLGLGTPLFLCNLAVSFAIACVSYSLVERPCLQWGRRRTSPERV